MAFPDGWAVRCPIDLAQTNATLADWTCVLNQNGLPADIFDKALEGGGDIRFSSDQDGTQQLPCHVRHFAKAGTANIAVKTNTSGSSTTRIWVWYLKAGETQPVVGDPFGQYATYDANYIAVWPFHEDPAGGGVAADATSNGNDLTAAAGANNPSQGAGQIYQGWTFDHSTPGEEDYATCSDLELVRDLTIEWIYNRDNVGGYIILGGLGQAAASEWFYRSENNRQWFNTSSTFSKTHVDTPRDVWNHLGVVWDTSTRVVPNGGPQESGGAVGGTGTMRRFGADGLLALPNVGSITVEEFRLSNIARTVAWQQAGYACLINPGTFFTVGTPEDVIGGLTTTVTATNAAGSDVESFNWVEIPPPP